MIIEASKTDKTMRIEINYPELIADMERTLLEAMEYARTVDESTKRKISDPSKSKSFKILTKEYNSEEP